MNSNTPSPSAAEKPVCQLCGEPMPAGEEMFNYHGYSGPCPKPPLPKEPAPDPAAELSRIRTLLDGQEEMADKIDAWYAEWLDDEDDLGNIGQMLADKLRSYLLGEEE